MFKIRYTLLVALLTMIGFSGFFCAAEENITMQQFLDSYLTTLLQGETIPASAQYIQVKYKNIAPGTMLYTSMQKAIYEDVFPNARISLPLDQAITQRQAAAFINLGIGADVAYEEDTLVDSKWMTSLLDEITDMKKDISQNTISIDGATSYDPLFQDVYERLQSDYIDADKLTDEQLIYGATKGLADATKDPYTTFYNPIEAKQFTDEMAGEFEGIGAYIEMKTPGVLVIIAPISGSPAEDIGIVAKDQVIQIDEHKITEDIDLATAISRVKGPEGSNVTLKILRDGEEMTFTVERKKIIIPNIEAQIIEPKICYMPIAMFNFGVSQDFSSAMNNFFSATKCERYIFDLRNNPGGSLEEVATMLDYFVPTGKASIVTKSKSRDTPRLAQALTGKITDKKIVLLINGGSASAAEIFAGTIKDYASHAVLIGEKSYGKGSVQSMIEYGDGSVFKYTTARRYTGKTQTSIDKVGLTPDILLTDNEKTEEDEVLEYASTYQFK